MDQTDQHIPHPTWRNLPWPIRLQIILIILYHNRQLHLILHSLIFSIILYLILPSHPLQIPTVIGGGLSISIIAHTI